MADGIFGYYHDREQLYEVTVSPLRVVLQLVAADGAVVAAWVRALEIALLVW